MIWEKVSTIAADLEITRNGRREIQSKLFHRHVIRDSIARDSTLRRKVIAVTVPAYAPKSLRHLIYTTRLGVAKRTRTFALY